MLFVAHRKQAVLRRRIVLAAPGIHARVLRHLHVVEPVRGEPLDAEPAMARLVVAVARAVVDELPRHARRKVHHQRDRFGRQHLLAVAFELVQALGRIVGLLGGRATEAPKQGKPLVAGCRPRRLKRRARGGRPRFGPHAPHGRSGHRPPAAAAGYNAPTRSRDERPAHRPSTARALPRPAEYAAGIQSRRIRVGEGLLHVPAVRSRKRRFDHAEQAGQHVERRWRIDRLGHHQPQHRVRRITKGRSLHLAQPPVEVLNVLRFFPQQPANRQLELELRESPVARPPGSAQSRILQSDIG